MATIINPLAKKYYPLSIYWKCNVCAHNTAGRIYSSAVHAYQAAKLEHSKDSIGNWEYIWNSIPDPRDVIPLCSTMKVRSDWNDVNKKMLMDILRQKFYSNPELGKLLLSTGSRKIVDNTLNNHDYLENFAGEALMEIRMELKKFLKGIALILKKHNGKKRSAIKEMGEVYRDYYFGNPHPHNYVFYGNIKVHGLDQL